jgi:hypothetical protein
MDFDAAKAKMKIEKLQKLEPQEEDPNQPVEEKQPLEGKEINSGWLPGENKEAD